MSAVQVDSVDVAFGSTEVLRGVCLSVPEHSITAVLGPSGSGRRRCCGVLAGFERPRSGRVTLAGQMVDDGTLHLPPERRRLGYVPQEGALFPHLDVARNVGFGLRQTGGFGVRRTGRAKRSGRIGELLDLVGLAELAHRYPHELSGGQQQRVALARALASDPAVVLLDEPFSSLDAALRAGMRAQVEQVLRATGTTVVLVTHDQQEALSMADQVAVLRHGRVAQAGTPREIYAHPVDPPMAAFLGDANLVDATVRGRTAVTALGELPIEPVSFDRGTALIRPEQITLTPGHHGPGLVGHVRAQTYQGHESVITVVPLTPCGADLLRVRVPGAAVRAPGSPVVLTATGPVHLWPADPPVPSTAPPG